MFRKVGLVSAPFMGAVALAPASDAASSKDEHIKIRPSDLSIYPLETRE